MAARTVNPPGDETAAAKVAAAFLDGIGIPYEIHESAPGRANIVGRIGSGEPVLLVACHLDTVPVGEGWTSDPFSLRVEDGRAFGRGVNDNKGPFAAALVSAKRLVETGGPARGTLLVAGLADEERGNEHGAKYLLGRRLLDPDYVIAPDSAGHMEEIDIAEKGVVFLKVRCRGKSAHASRPDEGVNAIGAMAMLINDLASRSVPSPPHEGFSPATMNVGRIRGGIAGNVVPDLCETEVDFRILPGTDTGDLRAFIDGGIGRVLSKYPSARFEVEEVLAMSPHEVGQDNFLVESCQRASMGVYGRRMRPLYQGGVTIAKEFALIGTPAVSFGPGSPAAAHQVDEWLEIDEALSFADFLFEAARIILR